jgi:hypothetical protein
MTVYVMRQMARERWGYREAKSKSQALMMEGKEASGSEDQW